MEPTWILVAFILGFIAYRLKLPPMLGYLVAGFALQPFGVEGTDMLDNIADLGIIILLFTIGLKLQVKSLFKPEIWAGATGHMAVTVVLFGFLIFGLSSLAFSAFSGLDFNICMLLAFALSFSSTVFAVKVLEEKGEMSSLHGRVAIGVLIMQDIFAVVFLTLTTGKVPSLWAIPLVIGLVLCRPILHKILNKVGHRELLLLFSVFLALGLGAGLFEKVQLKPDLGALILGMLIAGHPKASEMSDSLLSFKDLFLVGFFLDIGLAGTPTLQSLGIAGLLLLAIPFKVALFFYLFTKFKLRTRTAILTAFALANYSEFGLLVGSIGVSNGWLDTSWLTTLAIALSLSFLAASPLNRYAHQIYERYSNKLKRYETEERHPNDQPLDTGNAQIVVFGMGRVGSAAYDSMRERYGNIVIGVDQQKIKVTEHLNAGRNVLHGDAKDIDFWARIKMTKRENNPIKLVMLAMPDHNANMQAITELSKAEFTGMIAATAQFDDEVDELKQAGATAFNFYAEAGYGFANHTSKAFVEDSLGLTENH